MKQTAISLEHFLDSFPEVELPITLGNEAHHIFSKNNDPLSWEVIQQYILPLESEDTDELTEFIPCFRIPDTFDFHAVVYWKAGLMNYQYVLVTFTKKGILIDKRVIAGTFSDGEMLTQSVATIDEDWVIQIVSGQGKANEARYNASSSTAYQLELLPEGRIINS